MNTNNASTLNDLKNRCHELENRANQVSATLASRLPLTGLSQAAQESFLLALADVGYVNGRLEGARDSLSEVSTFNDANITFTSMCEQLGVSQEAAKAASLREFALIFDHLDSLLIRAQEEAQKAN